MSFKGIPSRVPLLIGMDADDRDYTKRIAAAPNSLGYTLGAIQDDKLVNIKKWLPGTSDAKGMECELGFLLRL